MSIFILKSCKPLGKGVPWKVIPHLKDENLIDIQVNPTQESINKGLLEWIIPDVPYNRSQIKKLYSKYEVIEEGSKAKKELSFQEKGKLKSDLKEKLKAAGVEFSKNATIKDLEALAKDL